MDRELTFIISFLRNHIPLIYDMNSKDLRYDTYNMYYRTYKYLLDLIDENKKLKEGKKW